MSSSSRNDHAVYPRIVPYDGNLRPESGGAASHQQRQQPDYYQEMATLNDQGWGIRNTNHVATTNGTYESDPSRPTKQQLQDYYQSLSQQLLAQQQQQHVLQQQQHALQQQMHALQQHMQPGSSPDAAGVPDHQARNRVVEEGHHQQDGSTFSRGQVTDDVPMEDGDQVIGAPGGPINPEVGKQPSSTHLNSDHSSAHPVEHDGSSASETHYTYLAAAKSTSYEGSVYLEQQQALPHNVKKPGMFGSIVNKIPGFGPSADSSNPSETFQNREKIAILTEELKRKEGELRKKDGELSKKEGELKRKDGDLRLINEELNRVTDLNQEMRSRHERDVKNHNNQVASLMAKMTEYQGIAEKLSKQLSSLEQANSKQAGGTGAHKDSHAIPPNLVKAATVADQAVQACTNKFIAFLREWGELDSHVAVASVSQRGQGDPRYRKYAVQAFICRRLFAGFENDCYMGSLDCNTDSSSAYLPANHENSQYYLQHQDLELRYSQYLSEYESVQKLGLQKIMDMMKTMDHEHDDSSLSCPPTFFHFCLRKLVSVMTSVETFSKEYLAHGSQKGLHPEEQTSVSLLKQLATNEILCDKLLKPFVNLAMAAFLLHRLAFQFHPSARIFRYAPGAKFDPTYMEHAVPFDDDDASNCDFVVGLMLIPGFQVGATIIKCKVFILSTAQ